MVQLCMTERVVHALHQAEKLVKDDLNQLQQENGPPLTSPAIGNPITHAQLIALSKLLRNHSHELPQTTDDDSPALYTLEALLKGCTFYTPPPPPKKEPVRHPTMHQLYVHVL